MAGFIFTVSDDGIEIIKQSVYLGLFSSNLNGTSSNKIAFEGTLADYCSINPDDNIYFFHKRKIYGVGKFINVGIDCKYKNYLNSSKLVTSYLYNKIVKSEFLYGTKKTDMHNHWICLFEPCPNFYSNGVDMDDLLAYKPQNIRRLRTMWKTSFIKIDDLENETIKEFIYLKNINSDSIFPYNQSKHDEILNKVNEKYRINPLELLPECLDSTGTYIKHEMALEAMLVNSINIGSSIFGKWDFVTHQLCASPFKPIEYMDKIDVFAYRHEVIENSKIITKYLIIELKADKADMDTVSQVAKYVDYVCKEYAYGNYELIEAYIVAANLDGINLEIAKERFERMYNTGSHPIVPKKWNDLHFVKYKLHDNRLLLEKLES